jgi:murein DD-endopeptidase MepM/ murein hydrolase activator NlpD
VSNSTLARHRKPSQRSPARSGRASRQQKPAAQSGEASRPPQAPAQPVKVPRLRKLPPIASALQSRSVRLAVTAVAALVLVLSFWPAAAHWLTHQPGSQWAEQADVLGLQAGGALGVQARLQPEVISSGVAVAPEYLNPLRNVGDLTLERIDQGVDFSGSGPVYAVGDGVVIEASADNPGWDGGWITYQLTNGIDSGLVVYVAEDVTPTVQVGQEVTPSTVVGDMFEGGEGIEIGWAQPGGQNAESQLAVAGGIGGAGPFPTMVGFNFDELLQSLGVPAAPNATEPASGLLPANYPTAFG